MWTSPRLQTRLIAVEADPVRATVVFGHQFHGSMTARLEKDWWRAQIYFRRCARSRVKFATWWNKLDEERDALP